MNSTSQPGTTTENEVGTYIFTYQRYLSTSDLTLYICYIEQIPTEILEPTDQTLQYTIDDDCMRGVDTSGSHCVFCDSCANGWK